MRRTSEDARVREGEAWKAEKIKMHKEKTIGVGGRAEGVGGRGHGDLT